MTFHEKFKLLKKRKGLTVRAIAGRLEVGVGTVSEWDGKRIPQPESQVALAALFGVTVEQLFSDTVDLPAQIAPPHSVGEHQGLYSAPPPDKKIAHLLQRIRKMRSEMDQLHDDVESLLGS